MRGSPRLTRDSVRIARQRHGASELAIPGGELQAVSRLELPDRRTIDFLPGGHARGHVGRNLPGGKSRASLGDLLVRDQDVYAPFSQVDAHPVSGSQNSQIAAD